jgi:hypothetical protein
MQGMESYALSCALNYFSRFNYEIAYRISETFSLLDWK